MIGKAYRGALHHPDDVFDLPEAMSAHMVAGRVSKQAEQMAKLVPVVSIIVSFCWFSKILGGSVINFKFLRKNNTRRFGSFAKSVSGQYSVSVSCKRTVTM